MTAVKKLEYTHLLPLLCVGLLLVLVFTPSRGVEQSRGGKVQKPTIERIHIGLKDFKLLAFSGKRLIYEFPITVGADTGPSPTGEFEVVNRLKNPWYTPDDKPAQPPGTNNPLGTRWIGIDKPHYGIHGTKDPETIGTRASEGCIRLRNKHVEKLYSHVDRGTRVIIKDSLETEITKLASNQQKKSESEEES